MLRGRFAPSPTGALHLGNLRSALAGWLSARAQGGEFLVRIEDLDRARCKDEHTASILSDLAFLGLTFDGPVVHQSQRTTLFDAAVERLLASGDAYPCTCSRADVARAVSAPHVGEEGPRYPGTCSKGRVSKPGAPESIRFRARPGLTSIEDGLNGRWGHDVAATVGDFVIRGANGVASYQLAVVVDDAAQGITEVTRGDDLLASAPRQLQLYDALKLEAPRFVHLPLVVQPDGQRLAKREGPATLQAFRGVGVRAEQVLGLLARSLGLGDGRPCTAASLVPGFSWEKVPTTPVTFEAQPFGRPG